jgi:diaminohydroxyphosphoribosylaminopyrimidine deaminase/5-amino-6-(5-phosphoribosylamino)uracil reductase
MARALELARHGEALASPNPMVGAVLVKDGRVMGEGFHTYDGRKHAEVLALERAGGEARGATLYVNLEPCCHTGRTGPCTQAILAAGVGRVVAAMADPNPKVAGRGLRELQQAGVAVESGVCQPEARRLNEGFACWVRTGLPLVTLKTALTLDGRISVPARRRAQGSVTWITSEESRAEVQRMRHASDALLTGIGTALADDPRLTDRTGLPRRRPLLRVVLDSRLRLPLKWKLARSAANDLLVVTVQAVNKRRVQALRSAGLEVLCVRSRQGRPDLRKVLESLGRQEMLSVLVEAGGQVTRSLLAAGLVDKVVLYYAPRIVGAGLPVVGNGTRPLVSVPQLQNIEVHHCGPDFCVEGNLRDVYRDR